MISLKPSSSMFTLLLAASLLSQSCTMYYMANKKTPSINEQDVAILNRDSSYAILRSGLSAMHMYDIEINATQDSLKCNLEKIGEEHLRYVEAGTVRRKYIYPKKHPEVLTEVHIYIPERQLTKDRFSLAMSDIQQIETIDHDERRTKRAYVLSWIGGAVLAASAVALIVGVIEISSWK